MSPERWQQIESILDEAMALPASERSAFLQRACNGDASLRAEVESFLIEKSRASDFLEQPVFALPSEIKQAGISTQPNTHSVAMTSPLVGQQLGSYKILSLLGKGAMGEVYLARDTSLDHEVAIKLLPAMLARDPERKERFKREARLQARLNNHPNIATIHKLEQSEDASFLVLEYVPGHTFADRLQQGKLKVADALPLFRQIADALATAHQQGIIHRDLKPANIKITPNHQIKVLDFGLAKLLHHEAPTGEPADALLTTRSYWTTDRQVIVGTVPYMSPEQTYGQELDHRTDIWALGCVMYEALTGQRPFTGFDTFDLFSAIRTQEPDWSLLPTDTPPSIRQLLQQCLQKDATQRLSAAQTVVAILAGEEKTAPFIITVKHWLRQWKKQVAVAVAASLVTPFLVGYRQELGTWLKTMAERPPTTTPASPAPSQDKTLLILPFKEVGNAIGSKSIGRGLAKALQDVFAAGTALRVMPFAEAVQANLLNAEPERVMKGIGVNLLLQGEVKHEGEQVTINYWVQNQQGLRLFSEATQGQSRDYAQMQKAIVGRVATALQLNQAALPPTLSFKNSASDRKYLEALDSLQGDVTRQSIKRIVTSLDNLHKTEGDSAHLLATLASAYFLKAQINNDRTAITQALQLVGRATAQNIDLPEIDFLRGQILYFEQRYDEAIPYFNKTLSKQPSHFNALIHLAAAYQGKGKLAEAELQFRAALQYWPYYWKSHNDLGAFFFACTRYQDALEQWRKIIELRPDIPTGYINVGNALFKLGQYPEAENYYRRAVEYLTNDQDSAEEAYLGWGAALHFQTRFAEAEFSFAEGVKQHPQSYLLHLGLGDAHRHQTGKEAQAATAYEQTRSLLQQQQRGAVSLARLAEVYAKQTRLKTVTTATQQVNDAQQALALIPQALRAAPLDVEVLFSAILVYHLTGDNGRATSYIVEALKQGQSLTDLEHDPDLVLLRITEEYQKAVAPFRKAPSK